MARSIFDTAVRPVSGDLLRQAAGAGRAGALSKATQDLTGFLTERDKRKFTESDEVQAALQGGNLEDLLALDQSRLTAEAQKGIQSRLPLLQAQRAQEGLDLQKEGLALRQQQAADAQVKAARDEYTQNVLGRIAAGKDVNERRRILNEIQKTEGGFAPNFQETMALQKMLTPEKASTKLPTSKVQEMQFLMSKMGGGLSEKEARDTVYGKKGKGKDGVELRLAKDISSKGNSGALFQLWDRAKKAGMSDIDFEKAFAMGGAYDPEKGWFDFGKKDVDIDALTAAVEAAEARLGKTSGRDVIDVRTPTSTAVRGTPVPKPASSVSTRPSTGSGEGFLEALLRNLPSINRSAVDPRTGLPTR